MAAIPYALSITHFVNSVGAKAGFAAIIGLALLILLFFTQSRETANLRRRADEAEQQLYQLQAYVEHLSRSRAQQTAAPASAPAAAQTTGAPVAAPPAAALAARPAASRAIPGEPAEGGGVATIPAAPAGVGAPALSSATRLIPLGEADEISIRALKPSTNGGSHDESSANGTMVTPPPAPPPSTAAGGSNGVARMPAPVPMPTMGAPAASEPAPAPRVALPRQRQPMPPPPPRRGGREPSGRRMSPLFFILAGVLAAAVVAVVLIFVTGSGNNNSAAQSSSSTQAAASSTAAGNSKKTGGHRRTAAATVTPSAVTVAVLNGTPTNHLAADVMGKLTAAGYKGNTTQNASETGVTSTIVGYTAPTYRNDALAVAKSLNLGPASVQGVSQGDRAKICGSTTACTTQVIVTAGADLAQNG
jgi:LytR cell envelope-related transcriptional attenuator